MDTIFEKFLQIKVENINQLSILDMANLYLDGSAVWKWSRSTLYNFMKKIEFVYDDRAAHYEYTESREDVTKMRDDYLDWIQNYRTEGRRIYYQDETWIFKDMACWKAWKDTVETLLMDALQFRPEKVSDQYCRSLVVPRQGY